MKIYQQNETSEWDVYKTFYYYRYYDPDEEHWIRHDFLNIHLDDTRMWIKWDKIDNIQYTI